MRNLNVILAGTALAASLLVGCTSDTTNDVPSKAKQVSADDEMKTYSYDQYLQLYKKFATDFQVSGYEKEFDHLTSPEIVIVDPEVTFGKREVLTVSGKKSDSIHQSTQNQIIYKEPNAGIYLNVDFIYLTHSLGKDMVNWDFISPEKLADEKLLKKFHSNTLAYNNILVRLSLISTSEQSVGPEKLNGITKSVVQFLEESNL